METVHAELARRGRARARVQRFEREPDLGQALAQRAEGIVGAVRGLGDGAQGRFVEPAAHDLAAAVAHQFRLALLVQRPESPRPPACRPPP